MPASISAQVEGSGTAVMPAHCPGANACLKSCSPAAPNANSTGSSSVNDVIQIAPGSSVSSVCSPTPGNVLPVRSCVSDTLGGKLPWPSDCRTIILVFAAKTAEHLKTCERLKPIDADGTVATLFEEAEEGLEKLYQLLIRKRGFARNAPELEGDNKDAVVDEYTEAISAIADLHNLMGELRWAFSEHDADLEKTAGRAISSPEEMRAFLKAV